MNYINNQSIFLQIADRICDRVLSGEYLPDNRIPSVRELSAQMEVNPNTAMRSFERLQQHGIIYNKRGIGYFIAPDAREQIREMRRSNFLGTTLPAVFKEMTLLEIPFSELEKVYNNYQNEINYETK